jgi:hypothetical protein
MMALPSLRLLTCARVECSGSRLDGPVAVALGGIRTSLKGPYQWR